MDTSSRSAYKRLLIRGVIALVAVLAVVFLLPRLLQMLSPFVAAFMAALILNPLVTWINRKLGTSRRIIALVVDLVVIALVVGLLALLIYTVAVEAVGLYNSLQLNWDIVTTALGSLEANMAWLFDLLPPAATDILTDVWENIVTFFQGFSKDMLSVAISKATSATTKTGSIIINFVIGVLATYFMISDWSGITAVLKGGLGHRGRRYFEIIRTAAGSALGGYLRSQLMLALFAFVVMFAALGLYGQSYALVIALLLAFVDLLPIVGTIAVLLPWGIIEWFGGNQSKGIFLVVLAVVFFLVRKVVEPKIMGSQTGLHPLVALMSTYVGMQFSGVWGAVLGPVVLLMIMSIAKSGIFDSTVKDIRTVTEHISAQLKGS